MSASGKSDDTAVVPITGTEPAFGVQLLKARLEATIQALVDKDMEGLIETWGSKHIADVGWPPMSPDICLD